MQSAGIGIDEAVNFYAVLEKHHRRDGLDAIGHGRALVLIGIHLRKGDFPFIIIAQPLVDRRDSAAGRAPGGPEIYDNGNVGFENFGLEIRISYMKQVLMVCHYVYHSLSSLNS